MMLLNILVFAILAGMVGLTLYELVDEVRGGKSDLHDHYHE